MQLIQKQQSIVLQNSRICSLLLFIELCSIVCSCSNRLNEIRDYKPAISPFNNGEIGAKLIGTYKSTENITIKGAPYELFIWCETNSEEFKMIEIGNMVLYDANKKEVDFLKPDQLKSKFEENSAGKYIAYFSIKDLELEFSRHTLHLDLQIKSQDSILNEKIQLVFIKNYKEYRSNDFIDKIMSI